MWVSSEGRRTVGQSQGIVTEVGSDGGVNCTPASRSDPPPLPADQCGTPAVGCVCYGWTNHSKPTVTRQWRLSTGLTAIIHMRGGVVSHIAWDSQCNLCQGRNDGSMTCGEDSSRAVVRSTPPPTPYLTTSVASLLSPSLGFPSPPLPPSPSSIPFLNPSTPSPPCLPPSPPLPPLLTPPSRPSLPHLSPISPSFPPGTSPFLNSLSPSYPSSFPRSPSYSSSYPCSPSPSPSPFPFWPSVNDNVATQCTNQNGWGQTGGEPGPCGDCYLQLDPASCIDDSCAPTVYVAWEGTDANGMPLLSGGESLRRLQVSRCHSRDHLPPLLSPHVSPLSLLASPLLRSPFSPAPSPLDPSFPSHPSLLLSNSFPFFPSRLP